jgi:hypothetical protein
MLTTKDWMDRYDSDRYHFYPIHRHRHRHPTRTTSSFAASWPAGLQALSQSTSKRERVAACIRHPRYFWREKLHVAETWMTRGGGTSGHERGGKREL